MKAPRSIGEVIDSPPAAGSGLHDWAFYAANRAAALSFASEESLEWIAGQMVSAGRGEREAHREASHAIAKAFANASRAHTPGGLAMPPPRPKPRASIDAIIQTVKAGITEEGLRERSPLRFCVNAADGIYRQIFGPEPETLVCIARSHPADSQTLPLREALPLVSEFALTCQNRMTARTGLNQEGKPSPRTNENMGPRKWLVVEFDFAPAKNEEHARIIHETGRTVRDVCSALLWRLHHATKALRVVCSSGGKSLHGWFMVEGWPPEQFEKFKRAALRLGADSATFTACQLVRIPDGLRDNGHRQTLIYSDF